MDKITLIKTMIDQDSENALGWYLLGLEYFEQKKYLEAVEALTEALTKGDLELQLQVKELLSKVVAAKNNPELTQKAVFKVIEGGKQTREIPIEEKVKTVTFADVGGLEDLKKIISLKIIKPFVTPGLFEKFKKKVGGGILLYGPPGCGKTYIAKATAGECQARFISVQISDILDPYLGMSEQKLKEIFATARAQKPSILFFDEMDALGYHRAKSTSELLRPLVDQLLAEIEGIDSNTDRLLIIAATNMPWDIDPAFKRPGRFDRLIFVAPPDEVAREEIFRLKLAERPVGAIDLRSLAKLTPFYSGADIEHVVELAVERVVDEILSTGLERTLEMPDLLNVISETKPSTLEWLTTLKNYVKYSNQSGLYDEVAKYLTKNKF